MTALSYMNRALSLARQQAGRTGKNPSVGCVLVNASGQIIGEGATGDGGRPHAEQLALSNLTPEQTKDCTAYVTLEPCRERSTDELSCSERLIEAGVRAVIMATYDPHPQGKGGADRLRDANIHVEVGPFKDQADRFYADFFKSVSK